MEALENCNITKLNLLKLYLKEIFIIYSIERNIFEKQIIDVKQ